jgi:hypothetical protein
VPGGRARWSGDRPWRDGADTDRGPAQGYADHRIMALRNAFRDHGACLRHASPRLGTFTAEVLPVHRDNLVPV